MTIIDRIREPFVLASARERVVLVHCSASSARQWNPLIEALTGFQAVPLDLVGHGASARWHGAGPLTLAEEAAAIGAACPDGAPFHLVGHSYGGGVALKYALGRPERLRSLTLIEPSSFHVLKTASGGEETLLAEIRAVAEAVDRGVLSGDYRRGMATFIDYWGGPGSWQALPEAKQAQLARLAVHVAHHFSGLMAEETSLAAYAGIRVPTLILCGTRSPQPSRAITRLLTAALPCARHRTIRDAGHMSPLTHPHEVNPLIAAHLMGNRCPGAWLAAAAAGADPRVSSFDA